MADNITITTNDMQKLSKAMLEIETATGKSMKSINQQAMFFALQSAAKATPPGTGGGYKLAKKHRLRPLVTLKNEWFSNIRPDLLSGLVVALALIPKPSPFR